MASSGRTPVKRVDRRPPTAALGPPFARGGARRARACSSRHVASAGPRARAGAIVGIRGGSRVSPSEGTKPYNAQFFEFFSPLMVFGASLSVSDTL